MPYKSIAQERYFNANRKKLEAQGVDVDEWNAASRSKRLPKKAVGILKIRKKKNASSYR